MPNESLKPLDRSVDAYRSVLITWLSTPNLNRTEVEVIQALLEALEKSLLQFDQLRRIALQPAFFPHIQSAGAKALAAGKLRSWSEHLASQT